MSPVSSLANRPLSFLHLPATGVISKLIETCRVGIGAGRGGTALFRHGLGVAKTVASAPCWSILASKSIEVEAVSPARFGSRRCLDLLVVYLRYRDSPSW